MPSPTTLSSRLMSFTSETGPRLMPRRTGTSPTLSRTASATNSAPSGSPRNVIAAPSPVSTTTRSLGGTCSNALVRMSLNRRFTLTCSPTPFFEYPTMSTNSTLQTSVRLGDSIIRGFSPGSAHPREEPFHVAHHALQVAPLHQLHHFLHLLELAEELVHRLHRDPGAGGDAALARGLDELGLGPLLRGHRV